MKNDAEATDSQDRSRDDARRLRQFPAFDRFSDHDLDRMVAAAQHSSHSKPWPLILEQTPSEDCFVLLDGEVGVYVGDDRVAVLGPGEVIGESALRQGTLRSATVTTLGPAEVLRIGREDLARLVEEVPALRQAMDDVAAKHVSDAPPKPSKPERTTLNATVPTEVAERFTQAATAAGMGVSSALEEALNAWTDRH